MIPSIGRIVHYRLSESDVAEIVRLRQRTDLERRGNPVREGDVFPLLVARIFDESPTEASTVNGQVFLDGNDTLWVTSRKQGYGLGNWFAPPRV